MSRVCHILLLLSLLLSALTIYAEENPFRDIRINIKANTMNQAISKAERESMNQFFDQVLSIHKLKLSSYHPLFQSSGQSLSLSLYNEVLKESSKPLVKGDNQSFSAELVISAQTLYEKSLPLSQYHYAEAVKFYQEAQREMKQFNTIHSLNRSFSMSIDHLLQCMILSNEEWIQAQMIINDYERFLSNLIVDAQTSLAFKEGDESADLTFSLYYYNKQIKIPLSGISISLISNNQVEKGVSNQRGVCRFKIKNNTTELRYQIHLIEELYSDKYEHPLFIQALLEKSVGAMQGKTQLEFIKSLAIRVQSNDFSSDQLSLVRAYYHNKGYVREMHSSNQVHQSELSIKIIEEQALKIGGYYIKARVENVLTDQIGNVIETHQSESFEVFSNKDRKDAELKLKQKADDILVSMFNR